MSRYDRPSHRVFMTFFYRAGWQVQFAEADLKPHCQGRLRLPIRRRYVNSHAAGKHWGDSESRQMMEYGVKVGRGGCYLRLTPEPTGS